MLEKPGDIRDLSLPRGQTEFVQSLKASSNAKIIAVYFGGRPRLLGDIVQNANSILIAFLPGPDGGKAVIDLIAGDHNPTGRLPITYPKYQDGGGIPYWHSVSDLCTSTGNPHEPLPHWAYTQCEIEWPFGHGLSYTTFAYSNLNVSSNIVHHGLPWDKKGDDITVSVDVENTGKIAGSDAVMFFIFEDSRHVTPEYKRLLSFERRTLAPGKKETVTMTLTSEALRHVGPNDDKHDILQIGQTFRIGIGSATDCRNRPNENGPCTEELTLELAGKGSYSPVCEIACILLRDKNCLSERKISASDCYSMCQSSSSPMRTDGSGWGWNYLNCIEPILLDYLGQDPILLESLRQDGSKCYEVDTMCRSVLRPEVGEDTNIDQSGDTAKIDLSGGTANIDQSGGTANIDQSGGTGIKYTTIIVSMFAGMIGTLIMLYPFYKHAFQNFMPRSDYKEIEFTSVGQDEDEFHIT